MVKKMDDNKIMCKLPYKLTGKNNVKIPVVDIFGQQVGYYNTGTGDVVFTNEDMIITIIYPTKKPSVYPTTCSKYISKKDFNEGE
jgi:hypothetical protein